MANSDPKANLDLFAARAKPREPLTVTQANNHAKRLLEQQLGRIAVVGEVSNHKLAAGHHYFSLKDQSSQLAAVMFRGEAARLRFAIKPGIEVVASGKLTIYSPYGRYQLVVDMLEPLGAGALQVAFEQLKARLAQEGLFAQARKRALPLLPRRVGVVTSPTGAVIRDIIQVATRRFPNANILLCPARVQGAAAAPAIAAAITRLSDNAERLGLDLLIIGRGGGSIEDLWCFNEEVVARAIAACRVPVVSAVGHETDFTIADFVADVRAPTPSAAAELVFPQHSALREQLQGSLARARRALGRDLQQRRSGIAALRARLGDGRTTLRDYAQRITMAQERITHLLSQRLARERLALHKQRARLDAQHPKVRLQASRKVVHNDRARMVAAVQQRLRHARSQFAGQARRLDALSPLGILDRGYSIALTKDNEALRDAAQVQVGDRLALRLARGRVSAIVDAVEPAPPDGAAAVVIPTAIG